MDRSIQPERVVITNMHFNLGYDVLCSKLSDNVVPAYDGMHLTFPG